MEATRKANKRWHRKIWVDNVEGNEGWRNKAAGQDDGRKYSRRYNNSSRIIIPTEEQFTIY